VTRYAALLPEVVLGLTGLVVFAVLLGRGAARAARARLLTQLGALLMLAACVVTADAALDIFWLAYRVDAFSQVVKGAVALGLLLATFVVADGAGQREDARGELFFFLITSSGGLVVMASAVEAVALYLALEIASFSLIVLVPLREGFPGGREAALKFLFVGLGSSVITLLGLVILVGLTGTTQLTQMALVFPRLAGEPALLFGAGAFRAGFLF
jgi:NADH-quinone oxidoreductase subunit N